MRVRSVREDHETSARLTEWLEYMHEFNQIVVDLVEVLGADIKNFLGRSVSKVEE